MLTEVEMLHTARVRRGWKFLGYSLDAIIFGLMVFEFYIYFMICKSDTLRLRLYILLIGILELFSVALHALHLYNGLIIHFEDIPYNLERHWSSPTSPILLGLVTGSVQLFVGWKIRKFHYSVRWMCIPVLALGSAGIVCSIFTAANTSPSRSPKIAEVLWLGTETLSDVFIATSLLLKIIRSKWFTMTDGLQSGLLPTMCAAAGLISYVASPTGIDQAFILPLSKVHVISLLSALNSRTATWFLSISAEGKTPATTEEKVSLMKNPRPAEPRLPIQNRDPGHKHPRLRQVSKHLHAPHHRRQVTDVRHPTVVFIESEVESDSLLTVDIQSGTAGSPGSSFHSEGSSLTSADDRSR
ncbi:hypothetical protein GYMLUDRAFT_252843 [Collybiopsis luxurians FD-317 M1]|uniref:Uncharacterized protein n=1 Tax=Collybiopsis luxurians FD-317 M1 TaxID=944289 RepID=A0A0D0B8V5_9AGAR|nr:hypothetical protein GYMLUDRAFT_252843 [Collybiopsis luxurians FD-317 M1]